MSYPSKNKQWADNFWVGIFLLISNTFRLIDLFVRGTTPSHQRKKEQIQKHSEGKWKDFWWCFFSRVVNTVFILYPFILSIVQCALWLPPWPCSTSTVSHAAWKANSNSLHPVTWLWGVGEGMRDGEKSKQRKIERGRETCVYKCNLDFRKKRDSA